MPHPKFLFFVSLFLSPAVMAATNPPMTIEALVTEAIASHPERKFYEAEIAAARAGRQAAGTWANPELDTAFGQKATRESSGHFLGEGLAWSVGLKQTFEWPGRLGLRKAIANRDVELAELGLARFRAALAGRVRELGYVLAVSRERAAAAQTVADRLQELREVFVQRDPAGLTPLLETRVLEATLVNAQRGAEETALAATQVLLELNQLRGQPVETSLTVAQSAPDFRAAPPLTDLLSAARTNSFALRLRAAELAQQGLRVELARNERKPAITAGPFISQENAADRERIVGLSLSLPLPLWNRNSAGIAAATARQDQAQAALEAAERDTDRQVIAAARTYASKVAALAHWRADSIAQLREAAELADRHYRLGAVPVATYVELQKQYVEAVTALLETRREALAAAATLETLCGLTEPLVTWEKKEDK